MAAALRNRELEPTPSRAVEVAEFLLQEAEQGRANISTLCFNCGTPEHCTQALKAIPEAMRRRLKHAKITFGAYPNLNAGAEQRQRERGDNEESVKKIARREDMTADVMC